MGGQSGYGGRMGQNGFGGGMYGMGGQNGGSQTPGVRVMLTVAFDPLPNAPSPSGTAIADRMKSLPALHFVSPPQVELVGRTATLRGTVASAHDRDLAEQVVRLEAAVSAVKNLLVVAPAK
jgi:hypothetical protein